MYFFSKGSVYKYFSCDQIKKNEMSRACSTYGRRKEVHAGVCWGNLRQGDHVGDLRRDGRIILKWVFKKQDGVGGGMD